MQRAFDLDVISPQDGHILCPDPAPSDFVSRVQSSSRTVNSTISRPKEILPTLIKSHPSGRESCIDLAKLSQSLNPRPITAELIGSPQDRLQTDVVRPLTR